ncbi:MAG: hypothetical protein K9N55_04055 [Phycisphaerae bacterium]|nr:hypothetical protein [Phycisphaerae bacterium]
MLNSRGFCWFVIVCLMCICGGAAEPVPVQWLDGQAPSLTTGVSWGVPWSKGAVQPDQALALTTAAGQSLPVQTWPLAYWPDGSLKWSGRGSSA